MRKTTEKITILGVSFALFLGGVAALSMARGTARTAVLAVVFAGLLTIAGVQTARRLKKGRNKRNMRFADIIGQGGSENGIWRNRSMPAVSHAQLFTGLSGSGALALAVAYVQYLCCRHRRDGDSCGECPDCKQIASLAHPDLHLVFPVNKQGKKSGEVMRSDEFLPLFRTLFDERGGYVSPQDWYDRLDLGKTLKGMIAAREADEIIRKLSFKSFEADYKTMLVWLPEAMNEEAANKILKILEEPWERTLFILVSEQPDRLLPTIISRTQGLRSAHRSRRVGAGRCGEGRFRPVAGPQHGASGRRRPLGVEPPGRGRERCAAEREFRPFLRPDAPELQR